MKDRQRLILMAARDRAARAHERYDPEPVWQPLLELGLPAREQAARGYNARSANRSIDSLLEKKPAKQYRRATPTVH